MTLQFKININPEYEKLVPEIPAQEFAALKADIKERGQLDPIKVNRLGIILDGHHRFRALQELGIDCKYTVIDFANELQEKLFVIDINLKRRHLNKFQRAELVLKEKPILEEIARMNSIANLKQNKNNNNNKNGSLLLPPSVGFQTVGVGRVNEQLGRSAAVTPDALWKVESLLQRAPPDLLDKARKGNWKIDKAFKKLRYEEKRQELINSKPLIDLPKSIKLFRSDFRDRKFETEIPDHSIDLILTDPPYDEPSLPLYKDLGVFAMRVLKNGGCLATIGGHFAIDRIIPYVKESGLKFFHILSIIHSGRFARMSSTRLSRNTNQCCFSSNRNTNQCCFSLKEKNQSRQTF
jgi:hypothetical protein